MHGIFPLVKKTDAQDPAYRPAHPFYATDLERNDHYVCWFRSCFVRATAKIASMAPLPRSSASGKRCVCVHRLGDSGMTETGLPG